jgi:hypothetical protein
MAQSTRQSRWEVGLDFCLGVVINLGVQAAFLPTFTLRRGLSFIGTFLTSAGAALYGAAGIQPTRPAGHRANPGDVAPIDGADGGSVDPA